MSSASFLATYFDGRTSTRHEVRVVVDAGRLRAAAPDVDLDVPTAQVRAVPPIAGMMHLLRLPGGGQLRTDEAAAVAGLFAEARGASATLRWVESQWVAALVAFIVIALAAVWTLTYGLPLFAKKFAAHVPAEIPRQLGVETLAVLDRGLCQASAVPKERQLQIVNGALHKAVQGLPDWGQYYVEFRNCPIVGANALALSDGVIVLTDDLVRLASDDDEIAAVLAHEIGHVHHRHVLRLAIQAGGVAVLVTALATDAVTITSLAAALPALLLQSGYSREFEAEADRFAIERLREIGVDRNRFADILGRIERSHGKKQHYDYLSTHPDVKSRVERARQGGS